jgi:hypothetical protein
MASLATRLDRLERQQPAGKVVLIRADSRAAPIAPHPRGVALNVADEFEGDPKAGLTADQMGQVRRGDVVIVVRRVDRARPATDVGE